MKPPNLHPSHITPETFQSLLNHYPTTLRSLARRKATARLTSPRGKKPKGPKPASYPETPTADLDAAQKAQVDTDVQDFLDLDEWRYASLPALVKERASEGESGGGGGGYLSKEDLIGLMDWKMKHGVFRPMLMGMVKANQENTVRKATADSFASIPASADTTETSKAEAETGAETEEDFFPKDPLAKLTTPLRGVGPATASLLLSVGTIAQNPEREIPFYSDDVYLWLCLGVFPLDQGEDSVPEVGEKGKGGGKGKALKPNGEINVKYNVKEYEELWDAVGEFRGRIGGVSCVDVEKVALVVRHYGIDGDVLEGGLKRKREDGGEY